ncbi:TPA: RapZ family nucleotide-binding protein, partial [Stenotrophomonas maltophilia]
MSTVTPSAPTLIIVSGLSGSGKSVALKTFEDQDYYCSDNLPINLLPDFVRSLLTNHDGSAPRRLAVGIDVRGQADLSQLGDWRQLAADAGVDVKVLFFEASDEAVLKRYADTRRRHPLSQLGLSLLFESFAYKRGVPAEADFVFDARVLPNPHWDPDLRALSGREPGVRDYLEAQPDVQRYLAQLMDFLDTWLPKLSDGTRSYVTVAFGCTGGKHRSVFLAERLARHAREMGWEDVATYHREQ